MSKFVQSQFEAHRLVGSGLLLLRWLGWSVAAHPVGTVLVVLLVTVFRSVDAVLVSAVVWFLVEGLMLKFGPGWYRSWSLGCRFARCWPSLWASITKGTGKAGTSFLGSGRLVCSCPWISVVPSVSGLVVSWRVRAVKGLTLAVLADASAAIAASSEAIRDVEILYGRETDTSATMSVSFGDVLETVEVPSWA